MCSTCLLAAVAAAAWDHIAVTLTRLTGDRELAEDCVQDAFARALVRWPVDGVPRKPMAWLMTTARNRALDRARRAVVEATKLRLIARETAREPPDAMPDAAVIADDRLELMFACAHPALPIEAQVALSLSALTGLPAAEIADAFLVTERTMRQRLFRAKQRLRRVGAPFLPPEEDLRTRLPVVLHVLYLMFNAGYEGLGADEPVRPSMLRDRIIQGELQVGAQLPSGNEMQASRGVTRVTYQHAIDQLRDAGLVVTRAGKGTFVVAVPMLQVVDLSAGDQVIARMPTEAEREQLDTGLSPVLVVTRADGSEEVFSAAVTVCRSRG